MNEKNTNVYILYAGKNTKVKKVVIDIKKYLQEELHIKAFDYKDQERLRDPNEDERHHRMTTLNMAIQKGEAIILHLDWNYLKSYFCLAEIYSLAHNPQGFIKERVVCIIHDKEIYNKLLDKEGQEELLSFCKNIIKQRKKIKGLSSKELEELEAYPAAIRKFFAEILDLRYKAKKCDQYCDKEKKEIKQDIYDLTVGLAKYLEKQKKDYAKQKRSIENINQYVPKMYKILYSILCVFFIMGAFIGVKYWKEKYNSFLIKSIKVENRIEIKRNYLKDIVTSSYYYEYRGEGNSNFNLRIIVFHREKIIPKKMKNEIKEEIEKFIIFLNQKIIKLKQFNNLINEYDNIELTALYYKFFITESLEQELSKVEKKKKIINFLKNQRLDLKTLIKKLKNNTFFRKKQIIKIKISNKNNDQEIKNTAILKYQNKNLKLYRIKQPYQYETFFSVPVFSGKEYVEESYGKKEYSIINHDVISILWYEIENNTVICNEKIEYELILYKKNTGIINKLFKCEEGKI